ncbi:low molecular weight phosphatase family protein [Blastococcus sp. TF02A-30]|nr:low molecular weight phosphatase family protein [Blastococcus sp. TF02A-30]
MASPEPTSSAFTLLCVCTGSICPSAFAERLTRAVLQELMGKRAATVRVASAGCRAVVNAPMHEDTAVVLKGYGAEAGDFRARPLDEPIAGSTDLMLTMTRAHRRQVLERPLRALQRTFTLRRRPTCWRPSPSGHRARAPRTCAGWSPTWPPLGRNGKAVWTTTSATPSASRWRCTRRSAS